MTTVTGVLFDESSSAASLPFMSLEHSNGPNAHFFSLFLHWHDWFKLGGRNKKFIPGHLVIADDDNVE